MIYKGDIMKKIIILYLVILHISLYAINLIDINSTKDLNTSKEDVCTEEMSTLMSFDDFGQGERTATDYTTYCYENGDGLNNCKNFPGNINVHDGEYAIVQHPNPDASVFPTWIKSSDHTGNYNGRMMVVNASLDADEFYRRVYTVLPDANVSVDLWILNIIKTGTNQILPNISFRLEDLNGTQIGKSISTGDIPEDEKWHHYTLSLNPAQYTYIQLVLVNNALGGMGNDLALDDIRVQQIFCNSSNNDLINYLDFDSSSEGLLTTEETKPTKLELN